MKGARYFLAVAIAAAMVSGPVSAATCWSADAVDAASIRDFDTSLMVATLRCRLHGVDISGDYNRFVREKRAVLVANNDVLRAQFAAGRGEKAGLDAFDRFATALANSHGAGSDTLGCDDYKALAKAAVAAAPNRAALLELAGRAGVNPALPAAPCRGQVAAR
ncbi:MAG: hypothetical protein J7494_05795 [Sphingobium sp.]|nr:hypothetical protein [Sphingobium sp.]